MINSINIYGLGQNFKNNSASDLKKKNKQMIMCSAITVSTVTGIMTAAVTKSYTSSWSKANLCGLISGLLTLLCVTPSFMFDFEKSGLDIKA